MSFAKGSEQFSQNGVQVHLEKLLSVLKVTSNVSNGRPKCFEYIIYFHIFTHKSVNIYFHKSFHRHCWTRTWSVIKNITENIDQILIEHLKKILLKLDCFVVTLFSIFGRRYFSCIYSCVEIL